MMQFQQNFKKILSGNGSLNEKDYRNIQVESVSKEQFEKQKKQNKIKKQQRYEQSQILFLQARYKRLVKKYNQNLKIIIKLIEQNFSIAKQLSIYSRVRDKINIISFIKQKLYNFKSWIYEDDIDRETTKQKIRANK